MFECIYIFPPQGSCTATMSCIPYFYSCSELLWIWKDDQDIKCPELRGPLYTRALLWPSLLFLASGLPPRHAGGPSVLAFCDISLVSRSQHCDVFTFGPLGMLPSWGGPSWVDNFGEFLLSYWCFFEKESLVVWLEGGDRATEPHRWAPIGNARVISCGRHGGLISHGGLHNYLWSWIWWGRNLKKKGPVRAGMSVLRQSPTTG